MKKVMMDKLNGCIFWLKMMTCYKNIILFGIKSSANIKKEFDRKPVHNKMFLITIIKSYEDEVIGFCDKKF